MEKAQKLIELHSTLFKEKSAYSSIYIKIYHFELGSNLETKPSKSENFFQAGCVFEPKWYFPQLTKHILQQVIKELVQCVIFPFEE